MKFSRQSVAIAALAFAGAAPKDERQAQLLSTAKAQIYKTIGDIELNFQLKLLRFLQEREIRPLGASRARLVDVRVIAATNKALEEEIRKGRFREDLYFRLNVIPIFVPPLRDRQEDIPGLSDHFMRVFAREYGRRLKTLDASASASATPWALSAPASEPYQVFSRVT